MAFKETLKRIRKQLNISQEQLARDLNISFSTINRWENGRTSPSKLAKQRLYEYCLNKGIADDLLKDLNN